MTLDQLMAFTVSGDHERQEQVFERLKASYSKEPYAIRRMLTEGAVRASDKRAQFIGLEAYEEAGGVILRDLFQGDDGGWLQDVALVDRLVASRLEREAEAVRSEGWRWIEVAPDFAYGHTFGLRQLRGEAAPLSEEETAAREALRDEYDRIEAEHADAEGAERGGGPEARRDRDGVGRPGGPAGGVRARRGRPGRRLRQHRSGRRPEDRARLRPARGRVAGRT